MSRDGSLEAALKFLEARGRKIEDLGSVQREEPLGPVLRQLEPNSIVKFTVRGLPYQFVSGLVSSRRDLYELLGVSSDNDFYELITTIKPSKPTYGEFERYYTASDRTSLDLLPALKFYADDGGYYITSSIFVACYDNVCNASIHRIMVSNDFNYAAVRVVPRHLKELMDRAGGSIPVAVVLGVDPVVMLAASLSPPLGVFELELAVSVLSALKLCKTPIYNIPVPCTASMVVEGVLGPDTAWEGPFVDLLDLYDAKRLQPVLHVNAIYFSRITTPFVHVINPGGMEHRILMGLPREAAIYESVRRAIPTVRKVRLTVDSGMWLHAVVSIRKLHEGDGKTAGLAALAAHPSLKHVVVVDEDIDPDNMNEVEWAIATRFQASRGLVIIPYARGSTLDPSAADGLTYKVIIDATAPIKDRRRYEKPRGVS